MNIRALSLAKGDDLYIFRYHDGEERQVLDEIARQAARDDGGLDWTDASAMAFQVARQMLADPPSPDAQPAAIARPHTEPDGQGGAA